MPDDERGPEREPGYLGAQSLDDSPLPVLAVAAAHALEHRVGGMLQGHVDVRHDARVLREKLDERVVERLRVEIKDAHPAHALHVRHAAHEGRQTVVGACGCAASLPCGWRVRSRPQATVSCEIRFSSTAPAATRRSASATTSSAVRERCLPRRLGMTQKAHERSHPSAIFSHALARDCVTTRGIARPDEPIGRVADEHPGRVAGEDALELEHVARAEKVVDLGHLRRELPGYLCERHPLTTSFLHAPTRLYSASSKIVSIDSFLASPMKPQCSRR